MKTITLLFLLLISQHFGQAQTQNSTNLLSHYLAIKNALVASKQDEATEAAHKFLTLLTSFDTANLTSEQAKVWKDQHAALRTSTESITQAKNLEKQRLAFATLSVDFWTTLKVLKPTTETLYYDYCPMKKSYWISTEEPIKNPYYGSTMLTCGKVAEKLN